MSPYRAAPPLPPKAPRASWWRRLCSGLTGLDKRLALRRCRHHARVLYPSATWGQRQTTAVLTWRLAKASGPMARANAEMLLTMHTDTLGPCTKPGCDLCKAMRSESCDAGRRAVLSKRGVCDGEDDGRSRAMSEKADPKCWGCLGTGKINGGRGCTCGDPRCLLGRCGCRRRDIIGRRVITPPGAAIKVTEILLSPEAQASLRTNLTSLGAVR